jgi:uncharacterized protein
MLRRRDFLLGLAACASLPLCARAAARRTALAASWQAGRGCRVGVLGVTATPAPALRVLAALDVPTRAHGLALEPGGTLLAVARRPGDWLLRWDRSGRALAWRWTEPLRAFTGHLLVAADGHAVYTTEMDLETGAGLLGVRDAASLAKRAEWPTHGVDPHEIAWDETRAGCLIVANGGVAAQPETGRAKLHLERMASSLVRLDAASGELLGQWRLADPRLSLRHLAWGGQRDRRALGVALQAEHDDEQARATAPVLALFDGRGLHSARVAVPLAGYGGDIAASAQGFAVACPRAQGVAVFSAGGKWRRLIELPGACPLALAHGRLWAGGRGAARRVALDDAQSSTADYAVDGMRLDNHWVAVQA